MKYIMIRPEYDNTHMFRNEIFIGGELYTPKEWEKIRAKYPARGRSLDRISVPVEVSRKKIYWSFGARFSPVTGDYMCENLEKGECKL